MVKNRVGTQSKKHSGRRYFRWDRKTKYRKKGFWLEVVANDLLGGGEDWRLISLVKKKYLFELHKTRWIPKYVWNRVRGEGADLIFKWLRTVIELKNWSRDYLGPIKEILDRLSKYPKDWDRIVIISGKLPDGAMQKLKNEGIKVYFLPVDIDPGKWSIREFVTIVKRLGEIIVEIFREKLGDNAIYWERYLALTSIPEGPEDIGRNPDHWARYAICAKVPEEGNHRILKYVGSYIKWIWELWNWIETEAVFF